MAVDVPLGDRVVGAAETIRLMDVAFIESDHALVLRKSVTWWTRSAETLTFPACAMKRSRCSLAVFRLPGLVRYSR